MAAIRHRVDVEVLATDPPFAHAIPPDELRSLRIQYRNLDKEVVWDLCSHPAVTGTIGSILGRDLLLSSSCSTSGSCTDRTDTTRRPIAVSASPCA